MSTFPRAGIPARVLLALMLSCAASNQLVIAAEVIGASSVGGDSTVEGDAGSTSIPQALAGGAAQNLDAPGLASGTSYALMGPAFTHHQQRTHARRRYDQKNWGGGIEQEKTLESAPKWERILDLSVLKDSFGKPSVFATTAFTRQIIGGSIGEVRAGLMGGVVYKEVQWQGSRVLFPVLGPILTIRQAPRGFGVEATYVYHRNETTHDVNGVFTLQVFYRF
jgi:hypothetical protein